MNPDQQSNYWKPDPEEDVPPAVPNNSMVTASGTAAAPAPVMDESTLKAAPVVLSDESITWQAKEYLHLERNTTWFVSVVAAAVVLLAIAILLMKAYTFALLIVVMAVAVIVLAKRPPRTLKYVLSQKGLYVEDQLHRLEEYKSFGVIHDEGEYSVMLVPTKRFSPSLTVYFPADLGEKIVDFLGQRLPMQDLQLDVVDRLVRKLRL